MKKILLIISFYGICLSLSAQDGTLDPSFGAGAGFVDSPTNGFVGFSCAIQTNGKIVVLATNTVGATITIRYNKDGTIDTTFGTNGVVTDTTGILASSVIIQPDGKIIIAGADATFQFFQLIRYNPDGTNDTTFGSDGVVIGPIGIGAFLALQTDGKIILAGTNDNTGLFVVVRYNTNGSVDTIFESGPGQYIEGITIQNDGKVIVAGNSSSFNLTVIRYNTDGTLDDSFAVAVAPGGIWGPIVLQPDGKIIIAGSTFTPTLELVRLNSDGSLDTTFGGGVISGPSGIANALLLQADGKCILLGAPSYSILDFQLVRYTSSGQLDTTFGTNGVVETPPGATIFDGALQCNGKIIAVGADQSFNLVQVARYLNSPRLTSTRICNVTKKSHYKKLCGTAQNPSKIFIYQNGILIGSTTTSPQGTNTWTFKAPKNKCSGYSVVALYPNGSLNTSAIYERLWLK